MRYFGARTIIAVSPPFFLLGAILRGMGLLGCDSQDHSTSAGEEQEEREEIPRTVELFGDLQDVHDPALIKAHGGYYLYSTGGGVQWRLSSDRAECGDRGDVLGGVPDWAEEFTEGDLWAPDIAYFNDRYHLYYSASTFGSGRSAIGLATNSVLSPDSTGYEWTDRGKVIESYNSDSYNAIDPAIFIDDRDRVWRAFGSWNETGIRMRRLDPETGKPSDRDTTLYSLAKRPNADENAIEAPYIIRRNDLCYLFVSFYDCCLGVDSDYNIRVGRSDAVTGPYVDREGTPMTDGGGTLVLEGWSNWKGPGHNTVLQDGGETMLAHHAYSVADEGTPYLRMSLLEWEDGWSIVPTTEED